MTLKTFEAIAVILIGAIFLLRRADVRLVLVLSAAGLFLISGNLPAMFVKMAEQMSKPDTVVPICSALGFAQVLRLTECDKHLVEMLLRPLRHPFARALLIPGGIVAGYLVNTAVVSQTGVAAVIGPILIPLLLANRISPLTAGSLLLLGSSMGGELFNMAAVEMRTLSGLTKLSGVQLLAQIAPVNLLACSVVLLTFWWLALRWEKRHPVEATPDEIAPAEAFKINYVKALIPLIPVVLLFIAPHIRLPKEIKDHITILVAMLIGVTAAALTALDRLKAPPMETDKSIVGAFFYGAGYAYTHVISLIVVATVFTEGIKACGLIEQMIAVLSGQPLLAVLASILLPWGMATISGTGIAPAVAVMQALVPAASKMHLDPVHLGTLTAMAAHFGRTMSPVAAVVILSGKLSGTEPMALVKRVAPALLAGGIVLILVGIYWLLGS